MDVSWMCGLLSTSRQIVPLKHVCISGELVNAFSYINTQFVYENDCEQVMEAIFTFPLHEVVIYHFDAVIGDRTIVAECRPKVEAMATYNEAVKSGHTAFVIQESDHCEDVFQMSIGNIPSKGKVTINLKYVGLMDARNLYNSDGDFTHSEIRLALPQVLNPRYSPGETKIADVSKLRGIGHSLSSTAYTLEFKVNADMPCDISGVASVHDQFDLEYRRSSKQSACIKLINEFKRDHDLQLVIKFAQKLHSMAVIAPGDENKDGVLLKHCLTAQFLPEIGKDDSIIESQNEIIFMVDRSGSMHGDNMRYAKCMLLLLLKSLPVGCWFQIVGFGSYYKCLFAESREYSQAALDEAMAYQRAMEADMGGTELFTALYNTFDKCNATDGRPRQVIVLTDGAVENADEVVALIHSRNSNARVFAIGLGEGASTTLVSGMARVGGGVCAFARDESELNSAAVKILDAALQRRADNVQVNWELFEKSLQDGGLKPLELLTIPQNMPRVYNGQYLTCHAFFNCDNLANLAGNIILRFEIMGKQHKVVLDAESIMMSKELCSIGSQPLHRLAGKFQLEELTREYHTLLLKKANDDVTHQAAHEKTLRERLEALSINLNLLTELTSLVGVDILKCINNEKSQPVVVSMGHTGHKGDSFPPWNAVQTNTIPFSVRQLRSRTAAKKNMRSGGFRQLSAMASFDGSDKCMRSGGFRQLSAMASFDGSDKCIEPLSSDKLNLPIHVQLADLQDFTGYWTLSDSLGNLLGVDLHTLTQHCPKLSKSTQTDQLLWATVLVLAYFEMKLLEVKDQWTLLSKKAMSWLNEELRKLHSTEITPDQKSKELVNEASALLHKLLKC